MGIQLEKGDRFNLTQDAATLQSVALNLGWQSEPLYEIDASVFMLGDNEKIPDERYFVFYNNPESLDGSVRHLRNPENRDQEAIFLINLAAVNSQIQEMVFVVTLHEGLEKQQTFNHIQNAFIRLYHPETGNEWARYDLKENFLEETAVEFGRIYRRQNEWRFQAVGQGYKAGLKSFLKRYHLDESKPTTQVELPPLEVLEDSPQNPAVELPKIVPPVTINKSQKAINLEKKLEQKAPHLFNLVKTADISLKKVDLLNHQARVALCLDVSGSMYDLYSSGKVQRLAEKVLALGCRFDDNASIDIFLFAGGAQDAGEMTIDNFHNFVPNVLSHYTKEDGTQYGAAIKLIRDFYFPPIEQSKPKGLRRLLSLSPQKTPIMADQAVYVMFVTDGETFDQSFSEKQLKASSYEPIFWQFMAIGSGHFAFLKELDEIPDRYLDNADFFSVADPEAIADQTLYDLMMAEYPNWVKAAKAKKLLRNEN